ncbi:MAG: hypothetical protein RLZZ450_6295 [Pseudomonadota bacterium]|jgi:hypothetical protein
MVMCVRRGNSARLPYLQRLGWLALAWLLASASSAPAAARAQLGEDLQRWADSTVGRASTKWKGPRVPFPPPVQRPESAQRLDSLSWPVSVHAGRTVLPARVVAALAAAEATYTMLFAAGFVTSFGDAGQGHGGGRDLYVVDGNVGRPPQGSLSISASAALDAAGNFSALDGARAFALLDARVPGDRIFVCTATALIEAQLFELDPAESAAMRRSSATYFARVLTGEPACDDAETALSAYPFDAEAPASGADWLGALSARQDQNRGTFLFDMWQLARQVTWEGHDLRASPDLLESIEKVLTVSRDDFALVAAELAEAVARSRGAPRTVHWAELPSFTPKSAPALGVLGSEQVLVSLDGPRPTERLRVFSRGEAPGRYTLSAQKLDARGNTLSRMELAPTREPTAQLHVELDAQTFSVLVSVTRVEDDGGAPDPDTTSPLDVLRATITVDAQQ